MYVLCFQRLRDSVVGVVTGLRAGQAKLLIPPVTRQFSLLQIVHTCFGACVPFSLPAVKRSKRDADHPLPSTLGLRMSRAIPLLFLDHFIIWIVKILDLSCIQRI
jgi:hypothetical protein